MLPRHSSGSSRPLTRTEVSNRVRQVQLMVGQEFKKENKSVIAARSTAVQDVFPQMQVVIIKQVYSMHHRNQKFYKMILIKTKRALHAEISRLRRQELK